MHKKPLSTGNRFYMAYRKIRFLARRGTLFSFSGSRDARRIVMPGGTFTAIAVNSSIFFLLAYFVIYFLQLFITGYTAVIFNIPAVVYYYDVDYLIRGIDWTSDSVSGVFSSGPLAMLVLSVFFLIIYKSVETETGILRLLLLWFLFHGLTQFAGQILVGAILNKGFGFVILYMFVMDTGKVILTIFMLAAMFTTGLYLARESLYTANIYFNDLRRPYRNKFIICQFILPFLAGNIFILLVKLPHFSYFDMYLNASMILFLIPILVRSGGMEDFLFDEESRKIRILRVLPVVTLALILCYRIVLGFGIRL